MTNPNRLRKGLHRFKPYQDRYYVNEMGWWFYTIDKIHGPFKTKAECVDACRLYIQHRDGVLKN